MTKCTECEEIYDDCEMEEIGNDGIFCDGCRGRLYKMQTDWKEGDINYTRIIPFILVDASAYAEWLYYDSDKVSLVQHIIDLETCAVEPLAARIKDTDQWADGCCIHTGHIQNEEELKKLGLINYLDGSDEIDEYKPTTKNLPIKWV